MNMRKWINDLCAADIKKTMPILSFPCISLMGITVKELIADPDKQAQGMKLVAERVPSAASVSMMDLSVEAEAFGSAVRFSDCEVPAVTGELVTTEEEAKALKIPAVGEGRTGLYVSAIEKACKLITDRPVFAGIIGPYSLAGRLVGVSEAMIMCYEEPEIMHTVLKKCAEFLTEYAKAYNAAGAHGIVMAEPLTGLLSPSLAEEFSEPYVKSIVDAVQQDDFIVIYHNCGNGTIQQIDSILRTGSAAYHFGNAISMKEMMPHIPSDVVAMGNVDPSSQFCNGTPESIRENTLKIMEECCSYKNFVISSGCDIPPMSPWENIDAYFKAVQEFYAGK